MKKFFTLFVISLLIAAFSYINAQDIKIDKTAKPKTEQKSDVKSKTPEPIRRTEQGNTQIMLNQSVTSKLVNPILPVSPDYSNVNAYTYSTSTGNTLSAPSYTQIVSAGLDDGASIVQNIGFSFVYEGTTYTQFSANSNGLMRLGSTVVSSAYINSITGASDQPKIMPMWDDLSTATNGGVYFGITGTTPNRILIVDWKVLNSSSIGSPYNCEFQVRLYETSNLIEFVYGTGVTPGSFSCGVGGVTATNYISITTSSHASSTSTANDGNATWSGSGRSYWFLPGSPDLTYLNPPTGWTYAVVPRNANDATVNSCAIPATLNQSCYMNWNTWNAGTGPTFPLTTSFNTQLYLDDAAFVYFPYTNLLPNYWTYVINWGTTIRGGRHTLKSITDNGNTITESNESNNTYSNQFVWNATSISNATGYSRTAPPLRGSGTYPNSDGLTFTRSYMAYPCVIAVSNASGDNNDLLLDATTPSSTSGYTGATKISNNYSACEYITIGYSCGVSAFYPSVVRNGAAGTGNYQINFNEHSGGISVGSYQSGTIGSNLVADCWEIYLSAGTYNVVLYNVSGNADLTMGVYPEASPYYYKKSEYISGSWADSFGAGGNESSTFSIASTGYYVIVPAKYSGDYAANNVSYNLVVTAAPIVSLSSPADLSFLASNGSYQWNWSYIGVTPVTQNLTVEGTSYNGVTSPQTQLTSSVNPTAASYLWSVYGSNAYGNNTASRTYYRKKTITPTTSYQTDVTFASSGLPSANSFFFYQVDMTMGRNYIFASCNHDHGKGASGGSALFDTQIQLYDASFNALSSVNLQTFNDDCGLGGVQSYIDYPCTKTATYYVKVFGYGANYGTFTIGHKYYSSLPLSGTYSVGISLLSQKTGLNLENRKFTRKVLTEVPIEEVSNDKSKSFSKKEINNYDISKNEIKNYDIINSKNGKKENTSNDIIKSNLNTKIVERDEDYYVLYENGIPYTGQRFFEFPSNDGQKNGLNDAPDAAGYFATIDDAVSTMNTLGISGPVTFLLYDAVYNTSGVTINSIANSSATNTVTIKPAPGISPVITGSVSGGALIKISGANYITIDGSNSGGTNKSLTINNTYADVSDGIWIASNGTTSITNVTVKNCNIYTGENFWGATPVLVSDGTISGDPGYFSNITIHNNNIQKGRQAIYCNGGTSPQNGSNLTITNNTITASGSSAIGLYGIYMQGVNGATVSGNEVANLENTMSQDDAGIWLANGSKNATLSKNKIYNLGYTGTGGYGAYGVKVTTVQTNCSVTILNNIIYNIIGDGWDYTSILLDNPIGICLFSAQTGLKVYNNSINLYGNTLNNSNAMSSGILLGAGTFAELKNNAIANSLGLYGSTGYGSCAVYAETDNNQFTDINYNNYYVNPSGSGIKAIGKLSTTSTATSLSAWVTATGKDAYSVSGDPGFTSNTNLIPNPANSNSWVLSGNGIHITGVTDDFAGTLRPGAVIEGAPDIGAYEFTASSSSSSPNSFIVSTSGNGLYPVIVNGRKLLDLYFSQLGTITSIDVKCYSGANPPGLSGYPTAHFINSYFTVTPTGGGTYTYDIAYYYSEPQMGSVVNENSIRLAKSDNNGTNWLTYLIPGTEPGYWTISTTNNWIKVYSLTSFSTFTNSDNNSPLPVELSSFTSAVNGRNAKLNWATASEINNAGFDVERKSINGEWGKIGYVQGNGNTASQYSYEDRNLQTGKYSYRLKQIDVNGKYEYHNLNGEVEIGVPDKFSLSQNYPNPFNPVTKIDFDLPFDSRVHLVIFDITGRELMTLANEVKAAGYYTYQFNAGSLSSGVYFYRIEAVGGNNNYLMTKKMTLIK